MTQKRQFFSKSLAAVVVAFGIVVAIAAIPASAATTTIKFSQTSVSIEYGEDWDIGLRTENSGCAYSSCPDSVKVSEQGTTLTASSSIYENRGGFSSYDFGTPLAVGTHTFTAMFSRYGKTAQTAVPATVKVTPAQLAVDLRVASVETRSGDVVVNAQLTGEYIDRFMNCYLCAKIGESPQGTWSFTIVDDGGKAVVEKTIKAAKSESRFASFYWHNVAPDSDFTASATFTPQGSGASNFDVTNESDVAYTSESAPTPGPGTPDEPVLEVPVTAATTVPLWAVLTASLMFAALLATAVVLAVSSRRRRRDSTEAPSPGRNQLEGPAA